MGDRLRLLGKRTMLCLENSKELSDLVNSKLYMFRLLHSKTNTHPLENEVKFDLLSLVNMGRNSKDYKIKSTK